MRVKAVGRHKQSETRVAKDSAQLVRAPNLPDIELLSATYVSHTFSRHTHETFAIGVVHSGVGAYDCERRRYVVRPGDVILINPGDLHTGGAGNRVGVSYRMCYIPAARLQHASDACNQSASRSPYFPQQAVHHPCIGRLVSCLFDGLEGTVSILEQEERLFFTLTRLVSTFCGTIHGQSITPSSKGVTRAQVALQDRYADHISLAELAALANLSPYHFLRMFRAAVGLPPHAYQTQLRIARAKALLTSGVPPAHVAAQVGFVDQSHFTRAFKRAIGIPPGQYARFFLGEPSPKEA